jgi:hypothetical protein
VDNVARFNQTFSERRCSLNTFYVKRKGFNLLHQTAGATAKFENASVHDQRADSLQPLLIFVFKVPFPLLNTVKKWLGEKKFVINKIRVVQVVKAIEKDMAAIRA